MVGIFLLPKILFSGIITSSCTQKRGLMEEEYAIISFWKIPGMNARTGDTICKRLTTAFGKEAFVIYYSAGNQVVITQVLKVSSLTESRNHSINYCREMINKTIIGRNPTMNKVLCKKIVDVIFPDEPDELDELIDEAFTVYTNESVLPSSN